MGKDLHPRGPVGPIREAKPDDLDALELLENRAHHAPWPREAFEEELENRQGKIWVIDGEEGLAAMVVFWRVLDEIEILDVAVDPLYQGRGFARALLATLFEVARAKGARRVLLEVRVSNERAIGLYRALGFQNVARRADYYEDNGEDAFVMALVLQGDQGDQSLQMGGAKR